MGGCALWYRNSGIMREKVRVGNMDGTPLWMSTGLAPNLHLILLHGTYYHYLYFSLSFKRGSVTNVSQPIWQLWNSNPTLSDVIFYVFSPTTWSVVTLAETLTSRHLTFITYEGDCSAVGGN